MVRGKQLFFFTVLCIAVGVGTLVALQFLTVSIRETLTGNIQARAGGDIVVNVNFSSFYQNYRSPRAQQLFDKLKADGKLVDWTGRNNHNIQITGYFNVPPSVYIVDPAKFPLYGQIDMVQPAGGNFKQLLSEPDTIVISKSLWQSKGYQLGERIEVSKLLDFTTAGDRSASLKIVGVIDPAIPGINFDPGLFVGFGIVSQQSAREFLNNDEVTPTTFYLKTTPGTDSQAVIAELKTFNQTTAANFPFFSQLRTANEVLGESTRNLKPVEDALLYIGLIGLLIGGLGCVNTMLVVVGRRTTEIATVKALGLKPRQTLITFTLEILILGAIGSAVGLVIGVALSLVMKGVVEGVFSRPLEWGLYPGPLITGFLVGTLTSTIFGFLPAYAAVRVRPVVVLRQHQSSMLPRVGNLPTLAIILLMTLALGLLAGTLIGNFSLGLLVAFAILIASVLLVALMYLAVFLTGKLPAPSRGPNLKMALRSFNRHRTRTATTLLVITVSLFFISLIMIISDSIQTTIKDAFDFNLGFNAGAVNVFSNKDQELQTTFEREIPGLQKIFISNAVGATLNSINGQALNVDKALSDGSCGNYIEQTDQGQFQLKNSLQVSGRSLAGTESISPNGPQKVLAGRNFTPADMTKQVLLVSQHEAQCYGIGVGDKVNMRLRPNNIRGGRNRASFPVSLEVIGIVSEGTAGTSFEQGFVTPFAIVNQVGAQFSIFFMQIEPSQIQPALTKIQGYLYGNFVFDFTDLINTFTKLLDQVLAFPLMLSLLSLVAGSILIANNVALAVLERQTEVGILKAIGAKRHRILAILLWENGLLGLLGGLIGIGSSLAVAYLIPNLIRTFSNQPNVNLLVTWSPLTTALLLGLGIGLAAVATVLSSWRAVQEKPLVVLRYE